MGGSDIPVYTGMWYIPGIYRHIPPGCPAPGLGPRLQCPPAPGRPKHKQAPSKASGTAPWGHTTSPQVYQILLGVVMVAHIGYIGGKCHWPHFRPGPGQLGKYSNTDNGGIYR